MSEHTNHGMTTLVLGGRGKTGARVARRLEAHGVPLRIGSRSGAPPFDWNAPATWAPVLRGITAAYVVYHPDLAFPGAAEAVGSFAELAVAHGVRRLVLLSGRGEPGALTAEQALRTAGAEWTIVRASWFCQNFSEDYLLEPVRRGEIALPAGDVKEPFIDAEDIADVAFAALTGDGHGGEVYEVTGPRLLTFGDAAAEIGAATGRPIRYLPLSPERFAASATADGLPADLVEGLNHLFTMVLDGRNAHLTDGVQRALGRQPRDFADYVRRTAATGVWDRP